MSEKPPSLTTPRTNRIVAAMPRSGIRAIMELAFAADGAINLCPGEPDFPTPPHITEAAARAARDGHTRYTSASGITPLREAAAERLHARNGLEVDADQIIATVGGVNALFTTLAALANRGDRILIPDPCWPNYAGHCSLLGLDALRYPLDASTGFEPDIDALEHHAATSGATMLLINTPSNPTGAVWRRETVAACVAIAQRHDLYLVADDVYDEMAFDGEHVAAGALDDTGRVISIYSVSKTYAMTGWRIGYLAAARPLIATLRKVPESIVSCPSAPAQWAALAALTGPQDCVTTMRAAYHARRDLAVAALRDEGLSVAEPRGAFYILCDISAATSDTTLFATRLVHEHGVACAPGETFGPRGAGLLRLSLAASEASISEGIRRIGNAVRCFV